MSTGKLVALAIWFLGTWALGTYGYRHYEPPGHEPVSWATAAYHPAQLFLLHTPHFELPLNPQLEVARWVAAASTAGGIVAVIRQLTRALRQPSPALYANHVVI
jgi:hypothetical protein